MEVELREFVRPTEDHKIQFDVPVMKPTKTALMIPTKSEPPAAAAFNDDSDEDEKPHKKELEFWRECRLQRWSQVIVFLSFQDDLRWQPKCVVVEQFRGAVCELSYIFQFI